MTTATSDNFAMSLDGFYEYLREVLVLYEKLVPMLKDEFGYIMKDDLASLDENMKDQQALMLRIKPFDVKIAEYQSALDISGRTLSEMALRFPEEKRAGFFELIGRFQQILEEVEFYKEKCRTLLQNKLYHINNILSKTEMQKDNTTYDQNAAEVRSSLFSKAFETKI